MNIRITIKRKANDYNISLPQTQLSQFFQENNIEYLDLLPNFIHQGKIKTLYRLQDTHWNIEGNQLAATILTEYLTKIIKNP
jgi:lysophospholipase L1-like esterase